VRIPHHAQVLNMVEVIEVLRQLGILNYIQIGVVMVLAITVFRYFVDK